MNDKQNKIFQIFNPGVAWVCLCFAFAVHVADEALMDFLSVWNPGVMKLKDTIPFLPLPTFSFEVWITGLILANIILFSLSPYAFRKRKFMVLLSYSVGVVLLLNGLQHMISSFYLMQVLPGFYSSPFLIFCSINLLLSINRQTSTEIIHNKLAVLKVQESNLPVLILALHYAECSF